MPSLFGDGVLERVRSTTLALLGVTAAVGLGLIAFVLQQEWPVGSSLPIPGLGQEDVSEAEVVAVAPPGVDATIVAGLAARGGAAAAPAAGEDRGPAGARPATGGDLPKHAAAAPANPVSSVPPDAPPAESTSPVSTEPAPPPVSTEAPPAPPAASPGGPQGAPPGGGSSDGPPPQAAKGPSGSHGKGRGKKSDKSAASRKQVGPQAAGRASSGDSAGRQKGAPSAGMGRVKPSKPKKQDRGVERADADSEGAPVPGDGGGQAPGRSEVAHESDDHGASGEKAKSKGEGD